MKKFLILIASLLVVAALIIILVIVKGNLNKPNNPVNPFNPDDYKDYELLTNEYISYKYINSYEEYNNFMTEYEISKSDYYKTFSSDDFNNKKYLFVVVPYDPCSETIDKDELKVVDNTYRVYIDVKYRCGLCAPGRKVLTYEVNKNNIDVKVYSKTVSRETCDPDIAYKPIIYIYPNKDMDLTIKLGNKDNLLYTYPKYKDNWNVHVTKDGNIYDYDTKRNYYGLYWEGKDDYQLDMSKGFVVKGEDTVKFLEDKLSILGLNDYEINEFIIYWIDKLEANEYNFISFRNMEDINASMPLYISEEPDTLIRVMMDYKPLDNYIEVKEQELTKVDRTGYTVVEWGGTKH
jgi:hypothetical protein